MIAGLISVLLASGQCGLATYYDPWYHGRETAMSTPDKPNYYSRYNLTAASWYFEIGQWISIRNTRNGRTVTVQVTDRGGNGLLDLSEAASEELSDDGSPDNFNVCVE